MVGNRVDMTNNTALVRSIAIYAICLPLAIILGFMIANPLDRTTVISLMVVMFLLILPLLLRWYHAWLITIWNMTITFMYLPGQLPGWMPVACVGFAVAIGHYILNRDRKFLGAPSVSWSLIVLGLVVVITAKFRGEAWVFHAFGDEAVGGKRYFLDLDRHRRLLCIDQSADPASETEIVCGVVPAGIHDPCN